MSRHMPLPNDEIETRSVLMRLYHSRQLGEAFYPARFVNGCAPQMEADGWIERHEQGWRLTETGVHVWAEMNRSMLRYKFQYGQKMFDEIRAYLVEGRQEMGICTVKDCGKPRMVNNKGKELTMCEDHQRAYWRKVAAKKANKQVEPLPMDVPAEDITSGRGVFRIFPGQALEDDYVRVPPPPMRESTMAAALNGNHETHDCDKCEAKAVLEALKAKSPKLAKLIDAMEAQERAAN